MWVSLYLVVREVGYEGTVMEACLVGLLDELSDVGVCPVVGQESARHLHAQRVDVRLQVLLGISETIGRAQWVSW